MDVIDVSPLCLMFQKRILEYGGRQATLEAIELEKSTKYEPPKPRFIWPQTKYQRAKARMTYLQTLK